jgi:hypothetical protein
MPRKNMLRRAQRSAAALHIERSDGDGRVVTPLSSVLDLRFIPNEIELPADPAERAALADACWACGKPGHEHKVCPDASRSRCLYCKEPGHKMRECPAIVDGPELEMKRSMAAQYERRRAAAQRKRGRQ